jgi:antitoxin YobK
MSIEKYEEALKLIEQAGGGDFEGSKQESLVAKAEAALGLAFPLSYRRFLLERGCGNLKSLEIFGLIDGNFEKSTVPNGIWLTLQERRSINLNPAWILISDGGDGTYYALDTARVDIHGECPVIRVFVDGRISETVADSFGSYLLEAVRLRARVK